MSGWRSGLAAALVAVGLWQAAVWTLGVPGFILPGPAAVAEEMWLSRGIIAGHAWVTILEIAAGLALGSALGAASAIGLAASPAARALVRPMMVFSQAIPVFALAPVLTLWFGFGPGSKIAMAVLVIYFPVTSSFFDALMRTNPDWLGMARVMGATPARILWRIRVPAALPGLATGLRLAAVYAPIGAIVGEWVGASKGLGYLMLLANGRAKTDLMFAAVLVLAVLALALYAAVGALSRRFLERHAV